MEKEETVRSLIFELLKHQPLAVLSTTYVGHPYASLIAFAFTSDLKTVLFATPRSTRKYRNLMSEGRAALLIDNRSNSDEDFHQAAAVTVLGEAEEVAQDGVSHWKKVFLPRHPFLERFVSEPTTALMEIKVTRYIMVRQFQNVVEYSPGL